MKRRQRHNPAYRHTLGTDTQQNNKKNPKRVLIPVLSAVSVISVGVCALFLFHVLPVNTNADDVIVPSDNIAEQTHEAKVALSRTYTEVAQGCIDAYNEKKHRSIESLFEPEQTEDKPVLSSFKTIMYKSTSERVQTMQERLIELGYLHIDETTKYFGPATHTAVIAFQRNNHLKQTGNANTKTLKLMFSDDAEKYLIEEGDKGDDVAEIQQLLVDLAYMGEATGYFGSTTKEAVKTFQKNNGIDDTGKVGNETVAKLYSPDAVPSPELAKREKRSAKINEFVDIAYAQLGKRYSLGSTGPNSFDCSGLVYYCLKQAGSSRRRLTAAGYSQVSEWTKITSRSNLEIGDLLFFYSSSSHSRIGHVGIYVGGGYMIDGSTSRGRIVKQKFRTDYWDRLYAFARRPW